MTKKQKAEPSKDELKRALADMVWQFAHRNGDELNSGGFSALEHAFIVLGLPDPIKKRKFMEMYDDMVE